MIDAEVSVKVGNARVEVEAAPDGRYYKGHVEELKLAVIQVCLAMDNDESRALAQRVEGTQS